MFDRYMTVLESLHTRWLGGGWALVPLRLVIGFGFAFHGYAKLARGWEKFADILIAIGVPAPHFMAWLTAWLELVGGGALMLGVFVLPFSIPLTITMLTALFSVHLRYGFSSVGLKALTPAGAVFGPVGYEISLLYIAGLFALAASAPSPLSVDRWLALSKERTVGPSVRPKSWDSNPATRDPDRPIS